MRRLLITFAMALGAGAAVAASASSGTADEVQRSGRRGSQCFNARMVTDFRPVNRDQVDIVLPGRGRVYRLDLGPGCFDIDWANRIALVSRTGSYVCGPLDAEIVNPSITGRSRCVVTGLRQLSQSEITASRSRRRR